MANKSNNKKKPKKSPVKKAANSAPYLSIIMPCYNEEKLIGDTLEKVTSYLSGRYSYEAIVVDDGSSDGTVEIATAFSKKIPEVRVVENGRNRGKGFTVKNGFLNARGDVAIFTDADLSTPIEEIEKVIAGISEGYDVVIGSRTHGSSDIAVHQPWWREIMGKTFNLMVQTLTIKGIKDTQCGFKGFTKKAYPEVFERQTIEGFGFDVEILFIASKFDFKIKEVGVTWINRIESRVNPFIHPILMMIDLFKIRLGSMAGRYK